MFLFSLYLNNISNYYVLLSISSTISNITIYLIPISKLLMLMLLHHIS